MTKTNKVSKLEKKVRDNHYSDSKSVYADAFALHKAGLFLAAHELIESSNQVPKPKDAFIASDIKIAYYYNNKMFDELVSEVVLRYKKASLNFHIFEILSDYIKEHKSGNVEFLIRTLEKQGVFPSYLDVLNVRKLYFEKDYDEILSYFESGEVITIATSDFKDEIDEIYYYSLLNRDKLKQAEVIRKRLLRNGYSDISISKEYVELKQFVTYQKEMVPVKKKKTKNVILRRLILVASVVLLINIFTQTTKVEKLEKVELNTDYLTDYQDLVSSTRTTRDTYNYEAFKTLFNSNQDLDYLAERFSEMTFDVGELFEKSYVIELTDSLVYYNVYYLSPEFNEDNGIYSNYTYNDFFVIDKETSKFTINSLSEDDSKLLLEKLYPESIGHEDFAYIFNFKSIFNPKELELITFDVRSCVYDQKEKVYELYFYMFNGLVDKFDVKDITLYLGENAESMKEFMNYDVQTFAKKGETKYFKVSIGKKDFEEFVSFESLNDIYFSVEYNYIDQ